MSMNPYIVKEKEGEAYTIQQFVTGKPLTEEEMLPDSHGIHPVSPLGFMMKADGTTLGAAGYTTGFVPYHADDTTQEAAFQDSYVVEGKYYMYDRPEISFPVVSAEMNDGILTVVANGLLPEGEQQSFFFINANEDDYTPTGLVSDDGSATFAPTSVVNDADSGTTTIVMEQVDIPFDSTVVSGKLILAVITERTYLAIHDPDSEELSGIYWVDDKGVSAIRKAYGYPESVDSGDDAGDSGCYASNGYSNREVADWVERKMGAVIRHACHPSSDVGDTTGAGAFVDWFTTCGQVDISGGAGKNAVMVPGFGLGSGYGDACPTTMKDTGISDPDFDAERKVLTFGYGTKHDAVQVDVGKTALPLDWPFTNESDYSEASRDNNITLIRDGALLSDGETVVGRLDRISRTCGTCQGTGTVHGEDADEPCPNCNGTGEEPDCSTCGGTGEVDGETCPACHGRGFCGGRRYLMNRVHVCLFNDFSSSDDTHGHVEGTTVLKKTFVNLATPITTKDGDEFEVTVSLPNVGIPDAFPRESSADDLKNLSGYYAYVSQPRVYVVSGTWEFSDTKVTFDTTDMLTYKLSGMFKDRAGDDLEDGTDVRVKLTFDAFTGRKFDVIGKIDSGKLVLESVPEIPKGILNRITRNADPETHAMSGSICGAAYVEPNNATLENVKTNLGLNAVRCEAGALGEDMGSANEGALDEFNKFYTADTESTDRKHVLFDVLDDGEEPKEEPKKDQRQIVATVYPTVTNTFPWALTGRRKLGFLDKLMTMEADSGKDSIYTRVYRMNHDILDSVGVMLNAKEYPLYMGCSESELYGRMDYYSRGLTEKMSLIGSVLLVDYDPAVPMDSVEKQPVRRALKAAAMLASDYRNARISRLGHVHSDIKSYLSEKKIMQEDTPLDSYGTLDNTVAVKDSDSDYENMANAVRLRHLPEMLTNADHNVPDSPLLDCYPYEGDDYDYYRSNPYGYGEHDTTDRDSEVPCEVADSASTRAFAARNSVVDAYLKSEFNVLDTPEQCNDLFRAAELCAIDFSDAANNLLKVYPERDSAYTDTLEPFDAFTKLVSPDNIPTLPVATTYECLENAPDQLPFISGDAYWYYRIKTGWAYDWNGHDISSLFIATAMPTDDELAGFLKDYVPSYGARLAVRNWDGYRVTVPGTNSASSTDPVYLTRMKWYDPDCDAASRGIYAADAFLVGSEYDDPNANRLVLTGNPNSMSDIYSLPPYVAGSFTKFFEKYPLSSTSEYGQYSVGYIRVFMKFTFSADAGRWYCTDYRQAPISYLSPLYGAKALDQKINGQKIWVSSVCAPDRWQDVLRHTYEEYAPNDINTSLVMNIMNEGRLAIPFRTVEEGGLGLNAPLTTNGSTIEDNINHIPHANFWSVRDHLRPATSPTAYGWVPNYFKDPDGNKHYDEGGGIMSDSVLWGQYDYPGKGGPEYHLPDTVVPDADLTMRRLIYAKRNETTRLMDTGDIQSGNTGNTVLSVSYGLENE